MLCNCYILFLLDSMHFTESDYHATGANVKKRYLKPDIIPTKNVHPNILQIFQPYTHTINDCKLILYLHYVIICIIFYIRVTTFLLVPEYSVMKTMYNKSI